MCARGRVLPSGRSICIILCSLLIRIVQWGAVVQRYERATDNQVVTGSNPTEAVRNFFAISFTLLCQCFFGRDT